MQILGESEVVAYFLSWKNMKGLLTRTVFTPETTYVRRTTVCPKGSDPFYVVSYYIEWVTTSWTYSMIFYFDKIAQKIHGIFLNVT